MVDNFQVYSVPDQQGYSYSDEYDRKIAFGSKRGGKKDRIRLLKILKRGFRIFCYSILAKFVIECLKSKLNILKVFKNLTRIVKFAMTIGAISLNFLLFRWTAGKVRNMAVVRRFLKSHPKVSTDSEKVELLVAGLLASRPVMWLNSADRNMIKLVLYMRSVEAFFQILYTYYCRFLESR